MDELVRKTGREIEKMGFETSGFRPTVLKTAIGNQGRDLECRGLGNPDGVRTAGGDDIKLFMGQWLIGAKVTGWIGVSFAGEGYEDFRRKVGIPFHDGHSRRPEFRFGNGRLPNDGLEAGPETLE